MIQEENTQRTVALMIRTTRLTESVLRKAMIMYLKQSNNRPETHGRISVRKLMGKDQGANTMEINNANIRAFNRVASKYNIDYAIQKDKTNTGSAKIHCFLQRQGCGCDFKSFQGLL